LGWAVFILRLGEIRDCTYENQQNRVSGLNFLITAIMLWNTRYLEDAVTALRETEDVPRPPVDSSVTAWLEAYRFRLRLCLERHGIDHGKP
jgi:hypothetical protein